MLSIVRKVSEEHPELLPTNLGHTCYRHTVLLVEKLRHLGYDAHLMCKSPGEGQYVPPEFAQRTVTGLDGKEYPCSGVSHDAIWCDGKQYDTIGSANEHDRPIYRRRGEPNWSFSPDDGPQIIASPAWEAVPDHLWRNNNPPLTDDVVVLPHPDNGRGNGEGPGPVFPSYEALGGDEGGRKISRQLAADYRRAKRNGLDDDSGVWQQRVTYDFLVGNCKTVEESIAKHRAEWCESLGIPVVTVTGEHE